MAKTYKSKITGNRHEKNPLDTQLFASVNSDLVMNMVATKQLPDSDPHDYREYDRECARLMNAQYPACKFTRPIRM